VWLADALSSSRVSRWLPYAMLTPKLSAAESYDATAVARHEWHARDWDYIDPRRTSQAIKEAIGLGLESRTRVLRSKGRSYEDIIAELGNENKLAEAAKVDISGANVTVKETATAKMLKAQSRRRRRRRRLVATLAVV
jgi:capsid protein